MRKLEKAGEREIDTCIATTFAMEKLNFTKYPGENNVSYQYLDTERWFRPRALQEEFGAKFSSIFDFKRVIFLWNLEKYHWLFVMLDMVNFRVRYYDSYRVDPAVYQENFKVRC